MTLREDTFARLRRFATDVHAAEPKRPPSRWLDQVAKTCTSLGEITAPGAYPPVAPKLVEMAIGECALMLAVAAAAAGVDVEVSALSALAQIEEMARNPASSVRAAIHGSTHPTAKAPENVIPFRARPRAPQRSR